MPDREKVIKSIKACAHHPDHDCESCDYCDDNLWCYNDQLIEDFISLLKEQEPVAPVLVGRMWECGKCHAPVGIFMDDQRDQFCRTCGRSVKWE